MTNDRYIGCGAIDSEGALNVMQVVPAKEIKVTIHHPERISEAVKQRKINRIYDILNPEKSR